MVQWLGSANPVIVFPTITTTYTVTGTTTGGTASASITIGVNTVNAAVTITTNPICAGQCTNITATGGGIYLWNTGGTTASITVCTRATTTYTVAVTATNGCSTTVNATVTVNPAPSITISTVAPTSCGACDGRMTANVSGGTPTYTYLWATTAFTPTITGLCAGIMLLQLLIQKDVLIVRLGH